MSTKPDFVRKKFGPLRDKTLRNALAHRIAKEFPRIGGSRICKLCADMILEVIFKHMRPQDHVTHGQTLWMAVSVNDPPRHRRKIADTDLVPVLLELSTRRGCGPPDRASPRSTAVVAQGSPPVPAGA